MTLKEQGKGGETSRDLLVLLAVIHTLSYTIHTQQGRETHLEEVCELAVSVVHMPLLAMSNVHQCGNDVGEGR